MRVAIGDEDVVHLDDLLLRRTRLGLLRPDAGLADEPRLRALCQPLLGWSDARRSYELVSYRLLIGHHDRLPAPR